MEGVLGGWSEYTLVTTETKPRGSITHTAASGKPADADDRGPAADSSDSVGIERREDALPVGPGLDRSNPALLIVSRGVQVAFSKSSGYAHLSL